MTDIRIADRKLNYVLAKANVGDIIRSYFPDWDGRTNVMCPFHSDTKPSLNITLEGKAHCYGCQWSATNLVALVATMEGVPYMQARDMLYHGLYNIIPRAKPEKFNSLLLQLKNKKVFDYVHQERGVSYKVAALEYCLGYDPHTGRITVPIFDQFKECVNIRYMGWKKEQRSKVKVCNEKDHGDARLYPEWKMLNEDVIVLVEGEWDCLIGRSHGLPTVTWTGGAGAWDSDYNWMFKNKHVIVLYDNDAAGHEGANHALKILRDVTSVEMIPSCQLPTGKDLSDWIRNSEKNIMCILETIIFKARERYNAKPKKLCPCCGQPVGGNAP